MTSLQTIPIIISACALFLSLFTYFKHDAKIKKQNTLINQFQLEKFRKETDLEKKAIIEANVIRGDKGKRIIKVYNRGKAVAKKVVVTFPGTPNVSIIDYPNIIDIKAQNSIEIYVYTYVGSPDILQINFEWQDELSLYNKDSQTIQI
ncbi:hypothetical protein ATB96_15790 [Elizabethkingia ursingii]|nr:hypothetical protein ATB96_15790 [Elizabethkingia ursingii]